MKFPSHSESYVWKVSPDEYAYGQLDFHTDGTYLERFESVCAGFSSQEEASAAALSKMPHLSVSIVDEPGILAVIDQLLSELDAATQMEYL